MKIIYSIVFLLVIALNARAQSVSGTVRDESGNPIGGATVSLLSVKDSSWLRSEVTGSDGVYKLAFDSGDYLLETVAPGFAQMVQAVALKAGQVTNLNIVLSRKRAALDAVTVTTKKPLVEVKPGMLVMNIENSSIASGSNALELLRRSPGVQVSGEGAISLRSRSGVEVYVDGRPSRLSGAQLTAYLQAMTADEIAQIELITQPSARYEAAGTAGIINIRTKAVKKKGTNLALSSTLTKATYWQGNGSAKITYRSGKLTLYASEYFNYVDSRNTLKADRKFYDASTGELSGNNITEQEVRYNSRFHRLRIGGEYALNSNTTIGLRAQAPLGAPESSQRNFTTLNNAQTGQATYNLGTRFMSNRWFEREVGALARHKFKNGGDLSFDGFYVDNGSGDEGIFYNTPTDANAQSLGATDARGLHFPLTISLLSMQTDYTKALNTSTRLEAGLKYRGTTVENLANYSLPDGQGNMVRDSSRSTRFDYTEAVPAAYVSLNRTVNDRLELQAGLRAEYTYGKGVVTQTKERFERRFLSLFPTVYASYKADSLNTLTLSYGRRLDRPNYYQLNPSRDYIDKYSYRVGNPLLMPQFTHNLELGYSWKGQVTATLSFTQTNGIISDYLVQDDQTKTAYEMPGNIAAFQQAGLSVNYQRQIGRRWTTNLYGDYYLNAYSGNYFGKDYRETGSSFSLNTSNQFDLGHKWSAELTAWYNGPSRSGVFTWSKGMGSLDAGVSRKFFSDSLVVKFAVNDILGTQVFRGTDQFANFNTEARTTWDARRAILSFNYNIGSNIETMQRRGDAERRSM